jgi:hypothetical protein
VPKLDKDSRRDGEQTANSQPANSVGEHREPREEILAALGILFPKDQVVELRAPDYPRNNATTAGYFDDRVMLAEMALVMSGKAPGLYVTLNEINPALLARLHNRVETWVKHTTTDADVVRRRWLLLDFDPVRPSGISSTDAEHEAALERAKECREWLKQQGWPEPVTGDSGNGAHLLYPIHLPNDELTRVLVERCLKAIAAKFGDKAVEVDTVVGKAAQLVKLYGTIAAKGDETEDRPHRQARLLTFPKTGVQVTTDQLEALAALAPDREQPKDSSNNGEAGHHCLDIPSWLKARGVEYRVKSTKASGDRTIYQITCPFNAEHQDASIMQDPDGKPSAKCFHNSCSDKGWKDFKEKIGPPAPEHFGAPGGKSTQLLPYKPFPVNLLPDPFGPYVVRGARAIGCDPANIALPLLTGAAAAIGNSRSIQLKPGWTEPSIVWTVLVGESGQLVKSPAYDLALRPILEIQERWIQKWRKKMRKYITALAESDKQQGEEGEKRKEPICRRVTVDDTTLEKLVVLLRDAPRGLLVASDELVGWLGSFNQYKPRGQGADAARWLSMHRGARLTVDRKTSPEKLIYVPRAAVCLTGTMQPGIMKRAFVQDYRDSGLLARFLLAMPPPQQRRWTEDVVSPELQRTVADVFKRLLELKMSGPWLPVVLTLTPGAKAEWVKFVNEHGAEQLSLTGDLASAWSKLEGYAARLALVLHCIRWASSNEGGLDVALRQRAVDTVDIQAGIALSRWFGHEAERCYAVLKEKDEETDRRRLAEWVQVKGGNVSSRDLQMGYRKYRQSAQAAEKALDGLVKAGLGHWVDVPSTAKGGRPTRVFQLVHVNVNKTL